MMSRGCPVMTSFVVQPLQVFVPFLLLLSCSSLAFQSANANENSRLPCQAIFSGCEIDRAESSYMNSWRGIGSLGANNWMRGLTVSPAQAGEEKEARSLGGGGGVVQRRRWSFQPVWKSVLQTSRERLNENIFSLERTFHRGAAFFSNLFGRKKQLHDHAVEQLHAVNHQLKHHAAAVHDDFKLHHVGVSHLPAACTLRQKLASIVKLVLEAMDKTQIHSGRNKFVHSGGPDDLTKNLKYLMGDSMVLEIVKQVCDSGGSMRSLSPCEQKFCDVFLGDPKTGILMVFSALKINPLKAAMDPQSVINRLRTPHHNHFQKRRVPSQADRKWLFKLAQTRKKLGHIIIHGVERLMTKEIVEAQSNALSSAAEHKHNFFFSFFNGGRILDGPEPKVRCKACLRREIFRWKRLTPKVLAVTCSSKSATDPSLTVACEFIKENKFVATTMLAYDLRIWERTAEACKSSHNSCDFPRTIFKGDQQLKKRQLRKQHQQHQQQQRVDHTRGGRGRGTTTTTTTHQQQHHHPVTMHVHNRNKDTAKARVLHHLLKQQQQHKKPMNSLTTESLKLAVAAATEMLLSHDEHGSEQKSRTGLPLPPPAHMKQLQLLLFIRSIRYHHHHQQQQHPAAIKIFDSSGFATMSFGTSTTTATTTTGSAIVAKDQFLLLRGTSSFKQQQQQHLELEEEEKEEAVSSKFVANLHQKDSKSPLRIVGKFSRNLELFHEQKRDHSSRDSSQFAATVL